MMMGVVGGDNNKDKQPTSATSKNTNTTTTTTTATATTIPSFRRESAGIPTTKAKSVRVSFPAASAGGDGGGNGVGGAAAAASPAESTSIRSVSGGNDTAVSSIRSSGAGAGEGSTSVRSTRPMSSKRMYLTHSQRGTTIRIRKSSTRYLRNRTRGKSRYGINYGTATSGGGTTTATTTSYDDDHNKTENYKFQLFVWSVLLSQKSYMIHLNYACIIITLVVPAITYLMLIAGGWINPSVTFSQPIAIAVIIIFLYVY